MLNGERRGGAAGIRVEVGDEKGRKKKRPELVYRKLHAI